MRKVFFLLIQALIINSFLIATIGCGSLTERGAQEVDITEYRYDNLPEPNEASGAMAEFQALSRFNKLDITYYFINGTDQLPDAEEHELVREAFAIWAAVSPLTFTETSDRASADIEISWERGNHGDGDPFDGPGRVLAHATFPNPFANRQVILHFDDDERWVNSNSQNVDLLTVAIHEIGHNLGLGHSEDPNAIMFASYRGPSRTLGTDDIAGIQALYGIREEAAPPAMPEQPPVDETPAPSPQQDSDGDGLSDIEETLMTGTDPANPDSDGDGLSDGFEVQNRLNPLNPDTDGDGVNDGQEVQQGSDPFMPDQDGMMDSLSQQDVQQIRAGLRNAINTQVQAFRRGDPSLVSNTLGGQLFTQIQNQITDLNNRDLVQILELNSIRATDARVLNNNQVELDLCPTWQSTFFRRSDGALVQDNGLVLSPQTVLMERTGNGFIPTSVQFHDAPAFCQ